MAMNTFRFAYRELSMFLKTEMILELFLGTRNEEPPQTFKGIKVKTVQDTSG